MTIKYTFGEFEREAMHQDTYYGIEGKTTAEMLRQGATAVRELAAYKLALDEITCLGWIEDTHEEKFLTRVAEILATAA